METRLLLAHTLSVFMMTGIIWLVQWVQYPLFPFLDKNLFDKSHYFHSSRITWIAGPLILIEIGTATAMVTLGVSNVAHSKLLEWLVLSLICVCSTAFLSVPSHEKLSRGWSEDAFRFLLKTNWIRTVAWSTHTASVLAELTHLLKL